MGLLHWQMSKSASAWTNQIVTLKMETASPPKTQNKPIILHSVINQENIPPHENSHNSNTQLLSRNFLAFHDQHFEQLWFTREGIVWDFN
jgi:hypothetical protein